MQLLPLAVRSNLTGKPVDALQLDGLSVEPLHINNDAAKFDLSLHVSESSECMTLAFAYDADLFDAKTIDALASCFAAVLDEVTRAPESRLSELAALGDLVPPRDPAAPDQYVFPVSFAQQRLWFTTNSRAPAPCTT